MNAYPAWS